MKNVNVNGHLRAPTRLYLCVQAGKSPMETKWFSVAAGSHPNVPKTMVNEWHQMFKSRRTDIFDDE